jgi:hypothetical protein
MCHEFELLREQLSVLTALSTFELRCKRLRADLTSEFCQAIPELSQFDVWKQTCQALECVSLFGVEIRSS